MTDQKRLQQRPEQAAGRGRGGRIMVGFLILSTLAVGVLLLLVYRGVDNASRETPAVAEEGVVTPSPPVSADGEAQTAGALPQVPPGANAAWQPLDIESVEPERIPEYKETVEGAVLVELSTEMWSWNAGDRITLAVPQIGAIYTPVIDRVETALGSNRSYVGRLLDSEFPYSFVITVGARNTFANLSTPQGSYELVGDTQLAWLMPTANMDQHVDYSQPDYFIPE